MRSEGCCNTALSGGRGLRCAGGVGAARRLSVALLLLVLFTGSALPQYDFSDEPLLASAISDHDVVLCGRYVREWTQDDGTLVLLFNGRFELEMGRRRMSAASAVVWIEPQRADADPGRHHELTIYLSGGAEVRELAGTVTVDTVLLVRGLRTSGKIIKYQDSHAQESVEQSPLYQQALHDRLAIEHGAAGPRAGVPEVTRLAQVRPEELRAQRAVFYRAAHIESARTPDDQPAIVATGGVYLSQAGGADAPLLEIRAQSAVIFPAGETATELFGDSIAGAQRSDLPETDAAPPSEQERPFHPPPPEDDQAGQTRRPKQRERGTLGLDSGLAGQRVRGVYLEGDVVLSLGSRFVRAARLYYDFEFERALILDAVFRADIPERGIPLYVRAAEIRQLSAREFAAEQAVVTTSEFFTPHYHVGAERVVVRDLTTRDTAGRASGPISGGYELEDATLNVGGAPLLWWPYSAGRLEASETLIRRLRSGYSSDRGYELETAWHLFNLLGTQPPEGYDATLRLDWFSERGPAIGVDTDYEREDHYGLFRGYFIHDDGEDTLGLLRRAQEKPSTSERGRVLWRHRHYLPRDWEATIELSYISDPYFLEEWRKSEFQEGKEQETLVYLKRARGVEAITFLANWRLLDFVTQTEHLPELAYRRIGDTFLDPLVLYHESRVGSVRYRPDDRHFFGRRDFNNDGLSDATFRGDVRQEAELPLKLGPLNLVPFAAVRGTFWDGQPLGDGGLWRGLGVYGVRGGLSFSRVYDEIESELLDIHRLRHIIRPDFAAWWSHSNTRSQLVTPFDYGIETIDDFYGVTTGLRQVWQTKRGAPDRRRTVDLLTLNFEVGLFGDTAGRREESNGYANPLRPENSRTRNYFAGDLIYRLSDTTSLLYDFNIDLDDFAYDRHNVSFVVERSPRLAYVFGSRFAGDIDMSVIGGGWNYKLSEKYITAVRTWFDLDGGDLGEVSIGFVRKLPRWHLGINFEYDNLDDDFTVSLSLWPEGIPEWTLGSRRFSGLSTSTGIRP